MNETKKPELKPANENPWYWIATLYGEQTGDVIDEELAKLNRDAWNRWSAGFMTHKQRELLEGKGFSGQQLSTLNEAEKAQMYYARAAKSGCKSPPIPPNWSMATNFSYTRFTNNVSFRGFWFFNDAFFHGATFSKDADFQDAAFFNFAGFHEATFSVFSSFSEATFFDLANFHGTTFSDFANFHGVKCADFADFRKVKFFRVADFVDAKFSTRTIFAEAFFKSSVPDFRGAALHEATEWDRAKWPPVPEAKEDSQAQVYAYERLKQEMERLKKHEDEQLFFRKELRVRRELFNRWSPAWLLNWCYADLSDYGQSVGRPLSSLLLMFVVGTGVFWLGADSVRLPITLLHAADISFLSLFSIFTIAGKMVADQLAVLPTFLKIFAVAESLLGALMLFLIGLALRNRFRMK